MMTNPCADQKHEMEHLKPSEVKQIIEQKSVDRFAEMDSSYVKKIARAKRIATEVSRHFNLEPYLKNGKLVAPQDILNMFSVMLTDMGDLNDEDMEVLIEQKKTISYVTSVKDQIIAGNQNLMEAHGEWYTSNESLMKALTKAINQAKLHPDSQVRTNLLPDDGNVFLTVPFSAFIDNINDVPSPMVLRRWKISQGAIQFNKDQVDFMLDLLPRIFWTIEQEKIDSFKASLPDYYQDPTTYQDRSVEFMENTINNDFYLKTTPDQKHWLRYVVLPERFLVDEQKEGYSRLHWKHYLQSCREAQAEGKDISKVGFCAGGLFSYWMMDRLLAVDYPTYLLLTGDPRVTMGKAGLEKNVQWNVAGLRVESSFGPARHAGEEDQFLKKNQDGYTNFINLKIKKYIEMMLRVSQRMKLFYSLTGNMILGERLQTSETLNLVNYFLQSGVRVPENTTKVWETIKSVTMSYGNDRLAELISAVECEEFCDAIFDNEWREYMDLPPVFAGMNAEEARYMEVSGRALLQKHREMKAKLFEIPAFFVQMKSLDRMILRDASGKMVSIKELFDKAIDLSRASKSEDLTEDLVERFKRLATEYKENLKAESSASSSSSSFEIPSESIQQDAT